MKKLLIITTSIALLTLTSCSKDSFAGCDKAWSNYEAEVKNAGQNFQQISLISQKYIEKYPNCGF